MNLPSALNLGELLEEAERFYCNWDRELANRLFDYFSFDRMDYHTSLSKGMKSTFNSILGIASRCALTIFDEPTNGMDAAVRKDFYRALLKDYLAHPRSIILSSHHVEEIEELLEDILLINNGQTYLHMPITDLKQWAIGLTGKTSALEKIVEKSEILHTQTVGIDTTHVVVKNVFEEKDFHEFKNNGIEYSSVSASDLCVYLTNRKKEGLTMSLVKTDLNTIIKKQYFHKVRTNKDSISSLIIMQLLALFFSMNGVQNSSGGNSILDINVGYYSADISIVFSMIWAFITAINVTTKEYRNAEFAFVTNRLSSNISNILFLLTASIFSGITAIFSVNLLQIVLYYWSDVTFINGYSLLDAPNEFIIGIGATIFYMVLVSAVGYLMGMLAQIHKLLVVIIPVTLFGISFAGAASGKVTLLQILFEFIVMESSFLLFVMKVIIISSLSFYLAFLLNNRMEGRK